MGGPYLPKPEPVWSTDSIGDAAAALSLVIGGCWLVALWSLV